MGKGGKMTNSNSNVTIISRPNPYVGPRSFKTGEKLYGRERETFELVNLIMAERIVLLHSPSGAGKSSLVNAAVIPGLQQQGYQVLPVMRVNMDPPDEAVELPGFNRYIFSLIESLEESIPENLRFPVNELYTIHLTAYLARYRDRERQNNPNYSDFSFLMLIVDQMEEILTLNPTDQAVKKDFFIQLGEALNDPQIFSMCCIREDYLAALDPYVMPIPSRFANRYRLNLLEVKGGLEAMRGPARDNGVDFKDDAARKLLDDLRLTQVQQPDGSTRPELGPHLEPVQLQVVCRRLWSEITNDDNDITLEEVQSLGDVNTALGDYYSLQVASVAGQTRVKEREIREWFNRKLITPAGIRGQVLMGKGQSDGLDNRAIWALEKAYLIRAEKRGGATWFELSHDRMIAPIRDDNTRWFDENLSPLQRQADVWQQEGRPDGMLVIGPDFLKMQEWAKQNATIMIAAETDFYNASSKAHQNDIRERRMNLIVRWMLVFSIVATIVAVVFFLLAQVAQFRAIARELAASSVSSLERDPSLGVMLALDSTVKTGDLTAENVRALHRALPGMRIVRIINNAHDYKIYTVVYGPGNDWVASGGTDGYVRVWNLETSQKIAEIQLYKTDPANDLGVTGSAVSPDGKRLLASGEDGKVHVFDTSTWKEVTNFQAHDNVVWGLNYSPDGAFFVTGGGDYTAKVWDASTLELKTSLGKANCASIQECGLFSSDTVNSVAISRDNKLIATGGEDNFVRLWDAQSGKLLVRFNDPHKHDKAVNDVTFSPDGTKIASASADRTVKVWDIASESLAMTITGHFDWVYSVAYSADGNSIYSASSDRTIREWDTLYGREKMRLVGHTSQVYDIAVSVDGKHLVSVGQDSSVRIWDISLTGAREDLTLDTGDKSYALAYSSDGARIATGGAGNAITIWDAKTGEVLGKLVTDGHQYGIEGLLWRNQDKEILSIGRDGRFIQWDVTAGKPIRIFGQPFGKDDAIKAHNGKAIFGLTMTRDQSIAATGGDDGLVRVWDIATGEQKSSLDFLKEGPLQMKDGAPVYDFKDITAVTVTYIAFSPDDKYVGVAYYNKPYAVAVWDWKEEKIVDGMAFNEHQDFVQGVSFSYDMKYLASVSEDGYLIIYDLATKRVAAKFGSYHIGSIFDVKFSPNSYLIATGGADGFVNIIDLKTDSSDPRGFTTGAKVPLYGNTDRINQVTFSPDGRHVASSSVDHTVHIFTLDPTDLENLARQRLADIPRSMMPDECAEYLSKTCENFHTPNIFDQFITFLVPRVP